MDRDSGETYAVPSVSSSQSNFRCAYSVRARDSVCMPAPSAILNWTRTFGAVMAV